jgi:hypothetical protein
MNPTIFSALTIWRDEVTVPRRRHSGRPDL